jgi:molybdate transport system substrate-binding protein
MSGVRDLGRALARALLGLLAALLASGCGAGKPQLEISAASSLRKPFTTYATQLHAVGVRYSFAGSDALTAQIQQGARPDVFASADPTLPEKLFAEGLVERPVVFAANRLVLAVPAASRITSLAAVERPGVTLALGSSSAPVGTYSERVIALLPPVQRYTVLANVRDREPDATGVVGKLLEGAVDAGFLYATDVAATAGRLRAVQLPASLQPKVDYAIAVVKGTPHAAQAHAFVAGLLRGGGRSDLLGAGFLAPDR